VDDRPLRHLLTRAPPLFVVSHVGSL
jgi:hypothetical protein